MAKVYTGRDGRLLLGANELVKVTSWSLQADLELLETTSLGSNARTFTPGIQGFNGSASLLYYKDDDGSNDAGTLIKKLVKADPNGVSSADTVSLTLRLLDGSTASDIALAAYITNATIGASVGEVVSAQITFQATGSLVGVTV